MCARAATKQQVTSDCADFDADFCLGPRVRGGTGRDRSGAPWAETNHAAQ